MNKIIKQIMGIGKKNEDICMTDSDKLQFLVDEPTDLDLDDAFGHKEYAQVLFNVVRSAPNTSFCIGVFGEWGTGKSGIKEHLKSVINQHEKAFACVDFDVWLFSQDNIQKALLDHVLDELNLRENVEKEHPNLNCSTQRTSKNVPFTWNGLKNQRLTLFLSAIVLCICIWLSGVNELSTWFNQIRSSLGVAGVLGTCFVIWRTLFSINVLREDIADSRTKERYNTAKEFGQAFSSAMQLVRVKNKNKRCVILVDNLDRCPQSEVEAVLSGIKTFFADNTCIYVILCDDKALRSRLDQSNIPESNEYLRKIFNTTIRINQPLQRDINQYCDKLLEDAGLQGQERLSETIVTAFATNPRRAKQLINRLVTITELAKCYEDSGRLSPKLVTSNLAFLAKLLVIEEDYREFWEQLFDNYYALDDLTTYAQHGGFIESNTDPKYLQKFINNRSLLDFLRDTSWVTSTYVVEFLKLQQSVIHPKVTDVYGLKRSLYSGNLSDFEHRIRQAKDDGYEKELINVCLEEVAYLRSADKWGLLSNTSNRLIVAFNLVSDLYKPIIAKSIADVLAENSANHIIKELDSNRLLDTMRCLEPNDRQVVLDKMFLRLDYSSQEDDLIIALSNHTDILNQGDLTLISTKISEYLDGQRLAWVSKILREIDSKSESAKGLIVEPLQSRILALNFDNDFNQANVCLELIAKYWTTSSRASKLKFANKISAVTANVGNQAALQGGLGETIINTISNIKRDQIDKQTFDNGIGDAILRVSRASPFNKKIFELLFEFGLYLSTNGANELARYIQRLQNPDIISAVKFLEESRYASNEKVIIAQAIINRSLSQNLSSEIDAVFRALGNSDEERKLVDQTLNQLILGTDITRYKLGLGLWNSRKARASRGYLDHLLSEMIKMQVNPGDGLWQSRNEFLASDALSNASEPVKRAVMDFFHNLLMNGHDAGRIGLINGAGRFTTDQSEQEVELLVTALMGHVPDAKDSPLVDVVLRYREWAKPVPILRHLCTYAAQALGNDDSAIEEIGHKILRILEKIYATNSTIYLRTNLLERANTDKIDKRKRFLITLNSLREKHSKSNIWPEVDHLVKQQ